MAVLLIILKKSERNISVQHKGTIALISRTSKVMLKILQARLQQYLNCELPDVKLDLEKAEEPEIKLTTSIGSTKNRENIEKRH